MRLFKCAGCYYCWIETHLEGSGREMALCNFCKQPRTSLETLKRILEVIEDVESQDLPKIIKKMAKHVKFEE